MSKLFVYSLLIIAFIIGLGAGYTLTPEYAAAMGERETTMVTLGRADRFIDLRYLNGEIAHHLSAINLAKQALEKSHREEIRDLAETIIKSDTENIKQLNDYKLSWYQDKKSVNDYEKVNLGDNDKKFDLRFLNALIAHHELAQDMAKEISTKSTRTQVLNLADNYAVSLSKDILVFEQWRRDWYGLD